MHACGINSAEDEAASTNSSKGQRQRWPALKKKRPKNETPAHRKRLRQGLDARYSNGLRVDSDSESDASYSSDSDVSVRSDDSSAAVNATADEDASLARDRIPHLQSHATKASPFWPSWLFSNNLKPHCSVPSPPKAATEILGYIRIHELVNKAISDDRVFSWGTRKVLLKILHMIELGLRIGKASGVLRKGDEPELGLLNTLQAGSTNLRRAWVEGIKDASQDHGTKAKQLILVCGRKVSATLLKMDIFFLQVPSTVQTWLKETTVLDETKERLKALVALVKQRIAPTDQESLRRGKAKARQRLLGVVPIVKKRRKRLRSRHPIIDAFLNEEDGADAFADLEDFIE
ncbi:hypothetical protein GQ600_20526 [Phytophthora cactorum]|nr:hypothetical protein GQ600_20526 [Phytophthora cactorum]